MKLIKLTLIRNKGSTVEINEGKIWIGNYVRDIIVGEKFYISYYEDLYHTRGFVTEIVEEIIDENRFCTQNHVYLHEEYIKEKEDEL